MTPEQLEKSAKELREIIKSKIERREAYKSRRADPMRVSMPLRDRVEHLFFMCDEIEKLTREKKVEDATRMLGFVQGAVWSLFPVCLDVVDDVTRPLGV